MQFANDSLLHGLPAQEQRRLDAPAFIHTMRQYNFNGLDRVLEKHTHAWSGMSWPVSASIGVAPCPRKRKPISEYAPGR